MRHLIICREYPPAPSGGIGTYALHISRLLAAAGETVHVIGQMWEGADAKIEEQCSGRLIVHRVPFYDWASWLPRQPHPDLKTEEQLSLFNSGFAPQCFSWQAALLAESIVENEGIDIVEGSDYEAPLYYFQLRRALGLGPKQRPTCFVHLHSPTEFIAQHNDCDMSQPEVLTAKRLENYSIAAADALVCPSLYLARQAEIHYGLAKDAIPVIPYPLGESRILKREESTWESGTICYVGRLERRKGVTEWIEAAVSVAAEYPTARFEFVGADTFDAEGASIRELGESKIPKDLKARFCFRGERKRSSLSKFLAQARIAVVPSRWENFPNTCLEAMGSGVPVIASRDGGTREMIEDGRTGWLAKTPSSEGLAEALKRALETPAARIAEMGRDAASDIRLICDNNGIVEKQLDFRTNISQQGAKRSLRLPVNLPWIKRPFSDEPPRRTWQDDTQNGLAVVVTCSKSGQFLNECLQSLKSQTREPAAVIVVDDGSTDKKTSEALRRASQQGWKVVNNRNAGMGRAKNAGIEAVLQSGFDPFGFVFLSTEDRLQPGFIAACESVLRHCPDVGVVSCWAHHLDGDKGAWIRPCPSFPYQWVSNEAAPFSAVRAECLREAGNFRPVMDPGYEDWDMINAVMAAGWIAVTVPEVLVHHRFRKNTMAHITNGNGHGKARRELLSRFPELIARDASDLVLLVESSTAQSLRKQSFFLPEHLGRARVIVRYPRRPALQVLEKLRNKILRHSPDWVSSIISRETT